MSVWRNWALTLETQDLDGSSLRVFQKFKTTDGNKILRAIRSSFIAQNAPTFTQVKFRIYGSNFINAPGKLIAESNAGGATPAKMLSAQPIVMLDTWWEFDYIKLREGVYYTLVPYDPTYVRTPTQHLAWRKDYPDPIYPTNNQAGLTSIIRQSYGVSFITAPL